MKTPTLLFYIGTLAASFAQGEVATSPSAIILWDGTSGPVTVVRLAQDGGLRNQPSSSKIVCWKAKSLTTSLSERGTTTITLHDVVGYDTSLADGNYVAGQKLDPKAALQLSYRFDNQVLVQANGDILTVRSFGEKFGAIPERK